MVKMTREERLKKRRESYQKNKEKLRQKAVVYYHENKEKRKQYDKEYHQTEKGKMNTKISKWKNSTKNGYGLICENREEYEYIYDRWLRSERCEEPKCNKEYTKGNYKSMDHCHLTGLFRNILCHSCNANLNSSNTSGTPNISWNKIKNCWIYYRTIKGKIHTKCSKDLEWLKNYKIEYEKENLYNK